MGVTNPRFGVNAVTAAGGVISSGTLSFANSNGVSFGVNGQTVTASAAGGPGGGLAAIYDGANSISSGTIQFTNANGVSFTINGQTISGSVQTNYLTTARASNDAVGLNTAQTNVTWTVNSSGISLNAGAYLTTAALSNHSHGVSFTSGSVGFQTLSFTNSNGISFNSGTQGIFGSHNAITTGRASTDGVGLNTAQTNVTWTVNSSGISLNAGGYAGTGFTSTTTAGVDVKATNNTSGLSMAVPAYLTTAMLSNAVTLSNIRVSAGTASNNLSAITFGDAGGVSFGLNGSVITGSAPAGAPSPVNFSAGTASGNLGSVVFSNSNGVSFGLNGSTITASVNAGGGATISTYHNHPINILTTVGAPANNSATIMFMPIREGVTATRLELPISVSVATAANTSSAAILYTLSAYIYTKNANTLMSVSSGSGAGTHTWNSNATGSMSGGRFLSAAMNVNAPAGNYFIGLHLSTRATGHAGPASTSLANTITMMGVGTAMAGAITFANFGDVTASSNGWYTVGLNSSTGNLTEVSLSNVTQAGTGFQRANIALRLYM